MHDHMMNYDVMYACMYDDYRQALNAMQMWRASSDTMSYGEMKSGEDIVVA